MNPAVVFLGPPGSGKGTQSEFIVNEFGYNHLSTGDLIRDEIQSGSILGKELEVRIGDGRLASDKVAVDMVNEYLDRVDLTKGLLADGFPRTAAQAVAFDDMLYKRSSRLEYVFYFIIDIELLVKRITGRRVCSNCRKIFHILVNPPRETDVCDNCKAELIQRIDDQEEGVIRERFSNYLELSKPLVEFYGDRVVKLNADLPKTTVFQKIKQCLKNSN